MISAICASVHPDDDLSIVFQRLDMKAADQSQLVLANILCISSRDLNMLSSIIVGGTTLLRASSHPAASSRASHY